MLQGLYIATCMGWRLASVTLHRKTDHHPTTSSPNHALTRATLRRPTCVTILNSWLQMSGAQLAPGCHMHITSAEQIPTGVAQRTTPYIMSTASMGPVT